MLQSPHTRVLLAALALLVAACAAEHPRGDAGLDVTVRISPTPAGVGPARVRVDVSDQAWNPRNGATVVLVGTREGSAGPAVVDTARGVGGGRYVAPAFRFNEPGRWTLTARVELPGGLWTAVDQEVTVVEAPPAG